MSITSNIQRQQTVCRTNDSKAVKAKQRARFIQRLKDMGPRHYWSLNAIDTCRAEGHKMYITRAELAEYARHHDHCAICECVIKWNKVLHADPAGPALDVVDGAKDVALQNIQILCYACSKRKGTMSMTEFVKYCKQIVAKYG